MRRIYIWASSLAFIFGMAACEEDDKMDMDTMTVPNGYALSAGTSTIFLNSSIAYDTEADWVTGANSTRFNNGDGLYDLSQTGLYRVIIRARDMFGNAIFEIVDICVVTK